jgi:hypothetical protein
MDRNGNKIWEEEVDERTCDCCQTSVAIGPNGPMIVYRDRSDREVRDIYIAQRGKTGWDSRPLHTDGWEINGCPVNGPQMECIRNTVAAAWYTEARKQPAVYMAFSTDGGRTFSSPLRIHDSIPLGRVGLVLADEQTAIVSWMEGDRILARRVGSDGSVGPIQPIGRNSTKRSGGFPQATLSGQELIFAWTDVETRRIVTARTAALPR